MSVIAFAGRKGGLGRTTTALLLTLGLFNRRHPVELVQVIDGDLLPAFPVPGVPQFAYDALTTGDRTDWQARLVSMIDAAHADGRDLVVDLPASSPRGWAAVLGRLDLLLVPVMPGPQEILGAIEACTDAEDARSQTSDGAVAGPWLLPVAWNSASRAHSEIGGQLAALRALRGDSWFTPPIVPWAVPRLLPVRLHPLFDPEAMVHVPALRPVADLLARAALRLAANPAAAMPDAVTLFGEQAAVTVPAGDGDVFRTGSPERPVNHSKERTSR